MSKKIKLQKFKLYINIHGKLKKKEMQEDKVKSYYTKVVVDGGPPSTQPIKKISYAGKNRIVFLY